MRLSSTRTGEPRAPLRTSASLLTGSTVAALVAYAAQPLLSRLYAPEAFGVADVFAAIVAVVTPVGSLRYDDALMLPERDADAVQLVWLAALLTLMLAVVLLVVPFLPVAQEVSFRPYLWLLAPALLILRFGRLSEMWLTRTERFGPLAVSPAARSGTTTLWRLAGGLPAFGATPGGLIYGFIAGNLAALGIQSARLRPFTTRPNWGEMLRLGWRYRRFALLTTPSVLLNNLTSRLPVFVLAWAFSEAVVGLFGRVLLALSVPLSLVGGALGRVFLPEAIAARRGGTLAHVARRFHDRLAWLGVYPTVALVVAGPDLFAFVFGEPWRAAGVYARWVSPWLLLSSIGGPFTALFDVAEKHRHDALTSVVQFVLLAAGLYAGVQSDAPLLTVACVGLAGVAGRAFQLITLWRISGQATRTLPGRYARPLVATVPGVLLMAGAMFFAPSWPVFAAALLGAAPYYALAWRREKRQNRAGPPR